MKDNACVENFNIPWRCHTAGVMLELLKYLGTWQTHAFIPQHTILRDIVDSELGGYMG